MEKDAAPRNDFVQDIKPKRQPLQLTPATIRRLKENDPLYKFVDYYTADGYVNTMTVEEYRKLYPEG